MQVDMSAVRNSIATSSIPITTDSFGKSWGGWYRVQASDAGQAKKLVQAQFGQSVTVLSLKRVD